MQVKEELYYLSSETKGADQLRYYYESDLRLLFAFADCWFSREAAHLLLTVSIFVRARLRRKLNEVLSHLKFANTNISIF